MKITKFLIASAVVATMLVSCLIEPSTDRKGERAVRIALNQEGSASRALGSTSSKTIQFTEGLLLFADSGDRITKRVTVEDNSKPYLNDFVGRGALTGAGTTITGVPSVSTKVYFVGNPSQGVKDIAGVGENISSQMTTVIEQASTTGGVENVTLFGEGRLMPEDTTGEKMNYTATLSVKPIVTRIEIGAITGSNNLTCKVTGIFINKYYYRIHVNGSAADKDVADNGTTVANYMPGGSGSYSSAGAGVMYDYSAEGLNLPSDKVWAYNLLAPKSKGVMPSIVLRLENVVVNGTALNAPQYVTFGTFKNNGADITELKQGHIWTVDKLGFNENDISPAPYVSSKSVAVDITLMDWEKYPVTVEY